MTKDEKNKKPKQLKKSLALIKETRILESGKIENWVLLGTEFCAVYGQRILTQTRIFMGSTRYKYAISMHCKAQTKCIVSNLFFYIKKIE